MNDFTEKSILIGNGFNINFGGDAYKSEYIIKRIIFNARANKYDELFDHLISGDEIAEVFFGLAEFTNDIVKLIKEKKVSTLANSRYVLVELPLFNSIIPMNVYDEFNKLQDAGFTPILAHPERYDFVTKNFKSLINLIESGILLQSNIGSITGKYGKDAKKNVEKMLKNNMVHFLATDSHNNTVYDVYDKAIKKIKKAINDEDIYEKIMYENPQSVLEDKEINVWYPKI